MLAPDLSRSLGRKEPLLWINPRWRPFAEVRPALPFQLQDLVIAEERLNRFSGLLRQLFPELAPSGGVIESPLVPVPNFQKSMMADDRDAGRWVIKADHLLPIAGSIKARGGIYEVLVHAEDLAFRNGLLNEGEDRAALASHRIRSFFAQHRVSVGSTGNLGLSIGVIAAALGFKAVVHMSSQAKSWKKERLRARGVDVVEHAGDYETAVLSGRTQAQHDPATYFVDDENSKHLFLGYGVAASRLLQQLASQRMQVDPQHPLFVYLPCGVGGAPGGITFGLRQLFGDYVHCFFAEPVASPCMLVRLASAEDGPLSVEEVGLDNDTEADGLAVAKASELVASMMGTLVSGVFTSRDDDLFEDLYRLEQCEGLRVEPSAAAGLRGPRWLLGSQPGHEYLAAHGLLHLVENATHILWTTGGSFAPAEEYRRWHDRGRNVATKTDVT